MRRWFLFALACLSAGIAVAAEPKDLAGWRGARWGMTRSALASVFDGALRQLPSRQIYGGAYADHALPGVEIGGEPFAAFFQMNAATARLQQVLLRRTKRQPSERAHRAVLDALRDRYGPADRVCAMPKAGGDLVEEHVWRFPTTTVHASFLDFYSAAMAFENPNTDRNLRAPRAAGQRNNPRFLPRRMIVRFHPSERTDLLGGSTCREP